ncbi:hypothetical protein EVAR_44360_1 [Eumeta japonica]|uniref:Uncharacterized protein n=1 Tax=Eumeta variegata TaxID=151549 RepID=A0A4C1X7U3_EUMVA|nr:hypothetical protein EVAR_44360_1 [Eumeta japonica]
MQSAIHRWPSNLFFHYGFPSHVTKSHTHDFTSSEVVGSASIGSFNTPDSLVDLTVCLFVRMCPIGMKGRGSKIKPVYNRLLHLDNRLRRGHLQFYYLAPFHAGALNPCKPPAVYLQRLASLPGALPARLYLLFTCKEMVTPYLRRVRDNVTAAARAGVGARTPRASEWVALAADNITRVSRVAKRFRFRRLRLVNDECYEFSTPTVHDPLVAPFERLRIIVRCKRKLYFVRIENRDIDSIPCLEFNSVSGAPFLNVYTALTNLQNAVRLSHTKPHTIGAEPCVTTTQYRCGLGRVTCIIDDGARPRPADGVRRRLSCARFACADSTPRVYNALG